MKKRTPVSKIMSSNPITVNTTQSLKDVDSIFEAENIRHLPVVSGNKVIGILSKTDLQKISFVNSFQAGQVTTAMYDVLNIEQVMTKNVNSIQKDDTIHSVAEILSESEYHALPVLDGDDLVGIVTSTDLIKYLADLF